MLKSKIVMYFLIFIAIAGFVYLLVNQSIQNKEILFNKGDSLPVNEEPKDLEPGK